MAELLILILSLTGLPLVAIIGAYLLMNPEKAERIAGWITRGIARLWNRADTTATALTVQGQVNEGRARFLQNAPPEIVEGKLKLRWKDVDEAETLVREGEVVVFMRPSSHKETNVARALMAYLPRAVLPRARRYLDPLTTRASDLVLAKSILTDPEITTGAIDEFYDEHVDPIRAQGGELRNRLAELDRIDLHGWLSRVLLSEYRLLGNELYPGEPVDAFLQDAESFRTWLFDVANQPPYGKCSLDYRGPYLNVSFIFVAIAGKLAAEGLGPYRKRAKRLLYRDRVDALYLLGRDRSIEAVKALANDLERDGVVASVAAYDYPLRADFAARIVKRDRAIAVCIRRKRADAEGPLVPPAEDEADLEALPQESFTFEVPEPKSPSRHRINEAGARG